jgi:hypothetical protein
MAWWIVAITMGLVGGYYGSTPTKEECEVAATAMNKTLDDVFAAGENNPDHKRSDFDVICYQAVYPPSFKEKIR